MKLTPLSSTTISICSLECLVASSMASCMSGRILVTVIIFFCGGHIYTTRHAPREGGSTYPHLLHNFSPAYTHGYPQGYAQVTYLVIHTVTLNYRHYLCHYLLRRHHNACAGPRLSGLSHSQSSLQIIWVRCTLLFWPMHRLPP